MTDSTPASANLPPPNQNEYETIQDPPPATRPYSSVSPQDMEHPNIYSHPRPVASPVENRPTSGPYNNTQGQRGEYRNCDVPSGSSVTSHHDTEPPYVDMTSPVTQDNRKQDVPKPAYENVELWKDLCKHFLSPIL